MDGPPPAIGDSVRISGAPPRGQLGIVIEENVRDGVLHFQVLIFDSKCWLPHGFLTAVSPTSAGGMEEPT